MNLQLEQILIYEADKQMRCDATELFFSNSDRKELMFTANEAAYLFYARHGLINPKDKAVYLEVIDIETGELMHLNFRSDIHDLMVKYMLYPDYIQKLFV